MKKVNFRFRLELFPIVKSLEQQCILEGYSEKWFIIKAINTLAVACILPIVTLSIFIFIIPIYIVNILYCILKIPFSYRGELKRISYTKRVINNHISRLGYTSLKLNTINSIIDADTTLEMFIERFFKEYNIIYDTSNLTGNTVCRNGKRRSLGDTYLICKYYFPNCTIDQVLKIIIDLLDKKVISGSYCNQINKFVFHRDSDVYRPNNKTEYGISTFQDVVDAYK